MFRNKVDVDRHVAKTMTKLKTEKDRNFHAYSIAKLYFNVGDYDSCCRYVELYLGVKYNDPAAHDLLGQAYQKLGQTERAIAEYKVSLDLDPDQNNLIFRVCDLLGSLSIDAGRARFWVDYAKVAFPNHPSVYTLKEHLLAARRAEHLLASCALLRQELAVRPHEPLSHVRLLRHLINIDIDEAFRHAYDTQFKAECFQDNIIWYESVIEVLSKYQTEKLNVTAVGGNKSVAEWEFWLLRLTSLEKVAELSLADGHNTYKASTALWHFDQDLFNAARYVYNTAPSRALATELLNHFAAQFYLHAATLLLKQAAREQQEGAWGTWAIQITSPLLLLALHVPRLKIKEAPSSPANILVSWTQAGAYRRSQAGHTLLSYVKEKKQMFLDRVAQYCSEPHWRDNLYRRLFTNREQVAKISTSYLQTSDRAVELRLPRHSDLQIEDMEAQRSRPECLHRQVWLGMNAESLDQVSCVSIEDLPHSINNLSNCGAETLNRLDLDAFLYCTIITTKERVDNERKSEYYDPDKPLVLPAIITEHLTSHEQSKWWECAYRVIHGSGADLSNVRLTLTRGIETVRAFGNHGLDPKLLIEIGKTFQKRSVNCNIRSNKRILRLRAYLYCKVGVTLLEGIKNGISIHPPDKRLFDYTHGNMPQHELDTLFREGMGIVMMNYINDPFGSNHLSNDLKINNKENIRVLSKLEPDMKTMNEYKLRTESLETQIQHLQRNNSKMSTYIEETKGLVALNRTLVGEVREMKKAIEVDALQRQHRERLAAALGLFLLFKVVAWLNS